VEEDPKMGYVIYSVKLVLNLVGQGLGVCCWPEINDRSRMAIALFIRFLIFILKRPNRCYKGLIRGRLYLDINSVFLYKP
jgi:hypothetical protein